MVTRIIPYPSAPVCPKAIMLRWPEKADLRLPGVWLGARKGQPIGVEPIDSGQRQQQQQRRAQDTQGPFRLGG